MNTQENKPVIGAEKVETLRRVLPAKTMLGSTAYVVMVGTKTIGIITQYEAGFEPVYANVVYPLQESLDTAQRLIKREFQLDLERISEPVVVPTSGIDTQVGEDRLKAWILQIDSIMIAMQTGQNLNAAIAGVATLRKRIQAEVDMRV